MGRGRIYWPWPAIRARSHDAATAQAGTFSGRVDGAVPGQRGTRALLRARRPAGARRQRGHGVACAEDRGLPRRAAAGTARPDHGGGQADPSVGPPRVRLSITPEGHSAVQGWLRQPTGHARDVRSELLVKLALLSRAGADPGDLLRAQRRQLMPMAEELARQLHTATGFDRPLTLWR